MIRRMDDPTREKIRPQHAAALLTAVFLSTLFFYTLSNDFPFYYHPDEPSKARQVLEGERNYHHPLLLLNATERWASLRSPGNTEPQRVAEAGREIAALFAAVAATALVATAWMLGGRRAALVLWPLLLLHHQFFELAHYFKEDTALLAGVSLCFLALLAYQRSPSPPRALFFGCCTALALSGKYIGAAATLPACAVFIHACATARRPVARAALDLASAAAGLAILLALVHWQLVTDPAERESLLLGLSRETEFVVAGHKGTTRDTPHLAYTASFSGNTNALLWIFMLAHAVQAFQRRRTLTAPHILIILFPLAYSILLSFSPKANDRYFLPATAYFMLLAALGIGHVADWASSSRWLRGKIPRLPRPAPLAAILLAVCILLQLPDTVAYYRGFAEDDREALIEYIRDNLPENAKIAQDTRVNLPGDPRKPYLKARSGELPQSVQGDRFAADLGTLEELLAMGFTHAAVCEGDYGRFFRSSIKPKDGTETTFNKRRAFYARLFTDGELLWERPTGTLLYFQPGLKLYQLPNPDSIP